MSDKLYDWETKEYVSIYELTKDGTAFISNNKTDVVHDQFIENKPDNQRNFIFDIELKEFFKSLNTCELSLFLLRKYGYSQDEIAIILNTYKMDISRQLTRLKEKYKNFIK
jgi:hypothetical protein